MAISKSCRWLRRKNDALVTVEPIASGIEIEHPKLSVNMATKLNPLS